MISNELFNKPATSITSYAHTEPSEIGQSVILDEIIPQKHELSLALENLQKRKESLLAMMKSIENSLAQVEIEETEIIEQMQKLNLPKDPVADEIAVKDNLSSRIDKIAKFSNSVLVIKLNETIESEDREGIKNHYAISLISKNKEEISIKAWPVNTKIHGKIDALLTDDGENIRLLDRDDDIIKRLIDYLSKDFKAFRKEINKNQLDRNGCYPNEYETFDCQRFAHYLRYGTEGTFSDLYKTTTTKTYREVDHRPGCSYRIKAQADSFGHNSYRSKGISVHHYVCLNDKLHVSKYGAGDVLFTSYQDMLNAYFPPQFTLGSHDLTTSLRRQ